MRTRAETKRQRWAIAAFAVAVLLGLVTVRLSGHYLPLGTIAWGLGLFYLFSKLEFLGRNDGISAIPPLSIGSFRMLDPGSIYFAIWVAVILSALLTMNLLDSRTGRAIRAVAKEKLGAELAGIDVAHIYAMTFGLGTACVAIAACLLIPSYYVNPSAGNAFVLVAFTIVVLGGMGSVLGALIGGLVIGVVESLTSLFFGESLGQIGIFVLFIIVLLVRPSGLFGARA